MTDINEQFQPDEQDLPEGWNPAAERDPRWTRIGTLLREADKPEPLNAALVEALRLDTRRKLLKEGLLSTSASTTRSTDSTFGEWLRQVFFGGGAPGQVLRLGVACGVAFAVGLGFQAVPDATTIAVQPEEPASNQVASVPTTESGNTRSTVSPGRVIVDASGAAAATDDWKATAPSGGWIYQPNTGAMAVTVSARPAGSGDSRTATMADVLDQLQILKLNSMMVKDDQTLAEIRRLERSIAEMTVSGAGAENPRSRAFALFEQAELYMAAQRYHDALRHFEGARNLAPGTALAFICDVQMAQISFEAFNDFAAAQEYFRRCLTAYPAHMVTGDRRAFVENRLQLLAETSADGWESLVAWQAAERANSAPMAVDQLLRVMRVSSSPSLLADAARNLSEITIRDGSNGEINAQQVADGISRRLQRLGDHQHSARIGFHLGEIYARRFQDYPRALAEYRAALERGPDAALERALRLRISQMLDERLTGLSPVE